MIELLKIFFKMLLPLAVVFAISNFLVFYLHLDIGKVADKDFLFNFFGILLGFSITIFAFIMSMIDKMRERLEKMETTTGKTAAKFKQRAENVYSEIKEDIYFTFMSLIIVRGMYIMKNVNFPSIHFFNNYWLSKPIFSASLKLSLFVLNLYAIYDMIIVSFRISDTTALVHTNDSTQ